MPRYFFDFVDNGRSLPSEDGFDLPDTERVRTEALKTLGEIAKGELAKNGTDDFQVAVRDESGDLVLTASLLIKRRKKCPVGGTVSGLRRTAKLRARLSQ